MMHLKTNTTLKMNDCDIRLEKFSEIDFGTLISWVKVEKELIQFAGPIFSFPLTSVQLHNYLSDNNRYSFKIIHNNTNSTIGHCEVYKIDEQNCKLCRILIGDKKFRRKGYGTLLTKILTEWTFEHLHPDFIHLNVYDFNISAIKSYENSGFKITAINETAIKLNNEKWITYKMTINRKLFYEKIQQEKKNI